jgi:nitrate reductase gamma subunit
MGVVSVFIANVLPYITIVVFVGGMIYRIIGWLNIQVPFPLSVTYPRSRTEQVKIIASEILFFPALLRNDRNLWVGAWPFHVALLLIFLGHLRLFTVFPDKLLMAAGFSPDGIHALSNLLGGAVGVLFLFAIIYLFVRRTTQTTVRNMSNLADYLVLLWLLGIAIAGNYMRFVAQPYAEIGEMRTFLGSIFAFHPLSPPDSTVFLIHFFLVQMLLISLPFSKLIHPVGMFFTQGIKNSLVVLRQVR